MIALKNRYEHQTNKLNQYKDELREITKLCREQESILQETEIYLQNIFYQSSMLLTLINDLLDLAKLETMNFTFNDEYFNLGQLIENAKDTIMYQAT